MKITAAYTRYYRDNGQRTAYVEWADGSRTEGKIGSCRCCGRGSRDELGPHMQALFARAEREGVTIEHQTW